MLKPRKSQSFYPPYSQYSYGGVGLKRETIKQLSRLGLCLGYEATLSAIDKIRTDFDSAALKLKADMEEILFKTKVEEAAEDFDNDLPLAFSMSLTHDDTQEEIETDTVLYSDNDENISYEHDQYMYHEGKNKPSDSNDSSEPESDISFYELNDPEESDQEDIEVDEEIENRKESM